MEPQAAPAGVRLVPLGVTPVATDAELVRGSLLLQEELRDVPIEME
ncbi:hypothetical protein [Brevibacillus parabrevis]|nr:hypothetical protein [Brevibacillus parabrevis]MED1725788.1 hypothetical protein [Brevibacillus parabrevis]